MLNEYLKIGEYEIAYDGVRLADYFIVRGVDMSMLPPVTANSIEIDGKPGAWFTGLNYGARDVIVRLGILNATRKSLEALEAWLRGAAIVGKSTPRKLELGGGYYVNAVLVGASEIAKNGRWTTTEVTFKCFDPYIYGQTHELTLKSGANQVLILGRVPVAPVFTVKSTSSSSIDIQNNATGQLVRVPQPGTTQNIVVDMKLHKCTLSGAYKAVDPSVSDFWVLEPGEQTVNIKSGSGTMVYTEAYL